MVTQAEVEHNKNIENELLTYFNHLSEIRRKTSHLEEELDELLDGVYTVKFIEPESKKAKPSKPDSRMARFARNNEASLERSK